MSLEERRKEKLMRNKAKLAEFGFSSKPAPALPKCENGNKEVSKPCNHQKSAGSMRVRKSEEEMHKEALIKSLKLPFGFKEYEAQAKKADEHEDDQETLMLKELTDLKEKSREEAATAIDTLNKFTFDNPDNKKWQEHYSQALKQRFLSDCDEFNTVKYSKTKRSEEIGKELSAISNTFSCMIVKLHMNLSFACELLDAINGVLCVSAEDKTQGVSILTRFSDTLVRPMVLLIASILSKLEGTRVHFLKHKGFIVPFDLLDSMKADSAMCNVSVRIISILVKAGSEDKSMNNETLLRVWHLTGLVNILLNNVIYSRLSVTSLQEVGKIFALCMRSDSSFVSSFLTLLDMECKEMHHCTEAVKEQMINGIVDAIELIRYICIKHPKLVSSFRRASVVTVLKSVMEYFKDVQIILDTCFILIEALCEDELLRVEWKVVSFDKIDTTSAAAQSALEAINEKVSEPVMKRIQEVLECQHDNRVTGKPTAPKSTSEEMFINQLTCLK